jgi:hypothetical protein
MSSVDTRPVEHEPQTATTRLCCTTAASVLRPHRQRIPAQARTLSSGHGPHLPPPQRHGTGCPINRIPGILRYKSLQTH